MFYSKWLNHSFHLSFTFTYEFIGSFCVSLKAAGGLVIYILLLLSCSPAPKDTLGSSLLIDKSNCLEFDFCFVEPVNSPETYSPGVCIEFEWRAWSVDMCTMSSSVRDNFEVVLVLFLCTYSVATEADPIVDVGLLVDCSVALLLLSMMNTRANDGINILPAVDIWSLSEFEMTVGVAWEGSACERSLNTADV